MLPGAEGGRGGRRRRHRLPAAARRRSSTWSTAGRCPSPTDGRGRGRAEFPHAFEAAHGEGGHGDGSSDLRYEVMYFLEAPDEAIPGFKDVWAGIGDSIVVVGGDGLWNCHIHTDDIGAADRGGHRHRHAPQDPRHRPARAGRGGALGPRGRRRRRRRGARAPSTSPCTCAVVAVADRRRHPPHLPLARRAGHRHRRPVDEPVDGRAARGGRGGAGRRRSSSCRTTRTSSRWPSRSTPTTAKTVRVVPTRGVAEGFAALLAYDPEAEADDNADEMADGRRQRRGRRGHPGGARLDLRRRARSPRATASASPATASAPSTPTWLERRHRAARPARGPTSTRSSRSSRARAPSPAITRHITVWLDEHRPGVRGRGPPRRPAALPVPLRHRVARRRWPGASRSSPSCRSPSSRASARRKAGALGKLGIAVGARPAHLLPAALPRPHQRRPAIRDLAVGEEATGARRGRARPRPRRDRGNGRALVSRRRQRRHRPPRRSPSSTSRGASGSCAEGTEVDLLRQARACSRAGSR